MTTPDEAVNLEAAVERLEPCPFCGTQPSIRSNEGTVWAHGPTTDGTVCVAESLGGWTKDAERTAAWNRRASNARAVAAAEYLCRLEGAMLADDLDMKLNFPGEVSPTSMAEMLVPGFDSVAYDLRRTTLASMTEKGRG